MNTIVMASAAIFLGMRHGVEFDHVAAIMDIVSSAPETEHRSKAMHLACFYALGHALMVAALSLVAMAFSISLPSWLNPIMEKVVGATLLFFGFYIAYSLSVAYLSKQKFYLESRWMIVMRAISKMTSRQQTNECAHEHPTPGCCDQRGAFSLGLLHGFGAETGTQVLLLSTVVGAGRSITGLLLLACFIAGMFISNTVIAAIFSSGAIAARAAVPLNMTVGALTACFSIWVGLQLFNI